MNVLSLFSGNGGRLSVTDIQNDFVTTARPLRRRVRTQGLNRSNRKITRRRKNNDVGIVEPITSIIFAALVHDWRGIRRRIEHVH